jgi:hypothetical protein
MGIQGYVSRGFESVRTAFEENFVRRRELGGAYVTSQTGTRLIGIRAMSRCEMHCIPRFRQSLADGRLPSPRTV